MRPLYAYQARERNLSVDGPSSARKCGFWVGSLTIQPESNTAAHGVDLIIKLLFNSIVGWINAHPASPFSRFMLRQHGPRTDVARMSRVQRLASALVFLLCYPAYVQNASTPWRMIPYLY
jgi:hypothetical protein